MSGDNYHDYDEIQPRTIDRKKHDFRNDELFAISPIRIYCDYLQKSTGKRPVTKSNACYEDISLFDRSEIDVANFDSQVRDKELDDYLKHAETDRRSIRKASKLFEYWETGYVAGSPHEVHRLFHISNEMRYNKRELFETQFFGDFGGKWERMLEDFLAAPCAAAEKRLLKESRNLIDELLSANSTYKNYLGAKQKDFKKHLMTEISKNLKLAIQVKKPEKNCNNTGSLASDTFKILLELRGWFITNEILPGKNRRQLPTNADSITSLLIECITIYDVNDQATYDPACKTIDKIKNHFCSEIRQYSCLDVLPTYLVTFEALLQELLAKAFRQVSDKASYYSSISSQLTYSPPHLSQIAVAALSINSLPKALMYFEQYCYCRAQNALTKILEDYERITFSAKGANDFVLFDPKVVDARYIFAKLLNLPDIDTHISPRTPGYQSFKKDTLEKAYDVVESEIGQMAGCSVDSRLDIIAAYNFLQGKDLFKFPRRTLDQHYHSKGYHPYSIQEFTDDYISQQNCEPVLDSKKRWEILDSIYLFGLDNRYSNSTELMIAPAVLRMYHDKIQSLYGYGQAQQRDFQLDELMSQARKIFTDYILTYDMISTIEKSATLIQSCLLCGLNDLEK